MKSFVVRTLVTLSFGAILSSPALLAQTQLNATIPFPFTVGTRSFDAGDYSVHRLNNDRILLIRNEKDGSSVMTAVLSGNNQGKNPDMSVLTFKRYGDRYFLSEVSSDNHAWQLFRSAAEKELIAKAKTPEPAVITVASK